MGRLVSRNRVAVALTASLVFSAVPVAQASAEVLDTEGYVTAAATKATQAAPEILGLSGVEETGNIGIQAGVLDWSKPKYYLMGTSEYNVSPNPYFANSVNNVETGEDTALGVVVNSERLDVRGATAALAPYHSGDDTDDAVWEMLPDVVIGVSTSDGEADYSSASYAGAIESALGVSYSPIGVGYEFEDNAQLIEMMYRIARAGDEVVTASNGEKTLRYGSAMDIARDYEAYIRGTQGYVLSRLAASQSEQKTIAVVESYDETTDTFNLITATIEEGYARTQNRYLEAVQLVSKNLPDVLNKTTVTRQELADYADAILVGGRSSGQQTEEEILNALGDLAERTFYVGSDMSSAGCMYSVRANSVENAQNVGRIIGFVYPEYVDQDDWMCYYFDNFYHIRSEALPRAIDNAMDGVRNYDAAGSDLTSWTEADAATYNEADVQAKIDAGMDYIEANEGFVPQALVPTDEWREANQGSAPFSDVTPADWYYETVVAAADRGYVNGYPEDGTFRPMNDIARAETAQVIYNMAGGAELGSAPASFSDVSAGDWFYAPVSWAARAGIVQGIGDTGAFAPDEPMTREQVAVMLWRYAAASGSDVSARADLSGFADASSVSSWAADAMSWAVAEGVFQGDDAGLRPADPITRAELATVAVRL